jgi:hypothetical protein
MNRRIDFLLTVRPILANPIEMANRNVALMSVMELVRLVPNFSQSER